MFENPSEWLNLLVRWFHVVAAIGWIGSSFFFMWLDGALEKSTDPNSMGSLWMVHSGGFYHVEKRILSKLPRVLHWFKWEALLTWISGVFLLGIVYYWGGLMEEGYGPFGYAARGLGIILGSWILYDGLWLSPIPTLIKTVLTVALIGAIILVGTHFLGARASYIHVGAAMGTFMVANVWLRILPAQRQLIRMAESGAPRNPQIAARAKMRSIHNNYMTLPVIFIMISNHFPSTYGSSRNWLILMGLMTASVAVRAFVNRREAGRSGGVWLVIGAILLFMVISWLA